MPMLQFMVFEVEKMTDIIKNDEKTNMPYLDDLRQLTIRYKVPVKYIEKFYKGLEDGKIYGTRCPVCGKKYFPPEAWCSSCGYSGEMDFYDLNREGTLLTFTVIYAKPASFSKFDNYIVGIAHLEKEDLNVLAWIDEKDASNVKVGMKIRLEVRERPTDGIMIYTIVKS